MLLARCVDSTSGYLRRNSLKYQWWKVILYVPVFKRRFMTGVFCTLSRPSFCPGKLSFALWLFGCSLFHRSVGFTEFQTATAKTTMAKTTMAVYACVIILFSFLCHPFQNNINQTKTWNTTANFLISFSNFDAVVHILFKISQTVLDKMNECGKFSRDSWVEYKVAF